MSKGKRISAGHALEAVQPLVAALGEGAKICGSLRRGKSDVGDVDIVIDRPVSREEVEEFGEWVQGGEKKLRLNVPTPEGPLQVDIVCCAPEERGGADLYLTGPYKYNILMRAHAKSMGYKLNEKGLWKGKKRIAGASEREIYKALELKFTLPTGREKCQLVPVAGEDWSVEIPSSRKGKPGYKVIQRANGSWVCPCPGFTYCKQKTKTCRHVKAAKKIRKEAA